MAATAEELLPSLHRALLARARELDPEGGEDLLQDAYLAFLEHRPRSRSEVKLKHWFRTVLLNMHRRRKAALKLRSAIPLEPLN